MTFCGSDKKYTDQPIQFDPLGRDASGNNTGSTGGPEARNAIFQQLQKYAGSWDQNGQNLTNRLGQAANDPIWGQLQQNSRNVAGGDYLNGTNDFNSWISNFNNAAGQQNRMTADTLQGKYLNAGLPGQPAQLSGVTQNTLGGKYLNAAPQMNADVSGIMNAVNQRAGANAADQAAGLRSQYARAGLGFSTANQQAQQSAAAAEQARANEQNAQTALNARQAADQARIASYMAERGMQSDAASRADQLAQVERQLGVNNYMAERGYQNQIGSQEQQAGRSSALAQLQARLNNYGTERQYQQAAGQQAEAGYAPMLNYLSAIPQSQLQPLQSAGQIVQGLAGNGQIATPQSQIVRQPGIYDYALATLGAVGGAAGGGGY